ncbi:pangolin [Echinococcus granulosus]|uniref:Pangolin n=1 Tax=Echinococcus granulosus TaxID=6210 RepID=W6UNU8_ECHGR|nr:pangolin [Echinococcus granulosus]EUB59972.1 pangolin [Echinococcus granulosus]
MSHMNSTGDESACTDELKVYKDEGEEEEQKKSSENLTEDKVGLVIEGEGHTPFDFNFIEHGASRKFACVSCFKPYLFLFPLCATHTYLPTLLSTLSPLRSPPVHAPARVRV